MKEEKKITTYDEENVLVEMMEIDEDKLPEVLSERVRLLEKANKAYDNAKKKEENARKKVENALVQADALISKAKSTGGNTPNTHSFLGFEWSTKADEIEAIKQNLEEIIDCGIDSAEAQKEFVNVQSALTESQSALLKVQNAQMEYQAQIADATKFLYGLSAYNIASTQSVLINLEAVLSGASKEEMGEMAKQQLFLVMDQLKSQESIVLKLKKQKEKLTVLEGQIEQHNLKLKAQAKKDEEHDRLLKVREEHDRKQDEELEAQAKKDEEHDRMLKVREEHDRKQDEELEAQAKKDEEHDRLLKAREEHDRKQDEKLEAQAKKDEEHTEMIINLKEELEKIKEEKAEKKQMVVAYVIASVSLVLTLIQFFM